MMKIVCAFLIFFLVFVLSGCGVLINSARELAGCPSLELIKARQDAVKQSFDISYENAFERSLKLLKEANAIIYLKNKQNRYIVVMGIEGCIDTTEAGVFFTEESLNKTSVEIASQSPKAKDFISSKIFVGLSEGK